MKKIFTLIAAALMAVGVNAQTITFGEGDVASAGNMDGKEFSSGNFKLKVVDEPGKMAIDSNESFFGTAEENQQFTHRLKSGGKSQFEAGKYNQLELTIPEAGVLKVYARTGSNTATDRTMVITQNDKERYNKVVQEADAVVVVGLDVSDPEKEVNVYPVIAVNVVAGTVVITHPIGSMNYYAFEFIAGASVPEDDPGDDPGDDPVNSNGFVNFPAVKGVGYVLGGTTTETTVKIHKNTDAVPCLKFANGYTSEGLINANRIDLECEGGFKAGDVVTYAGAYNNKDEKQSAITIFTGNEGEAPTALFTSEQFINGYDTDDEPNGGTYTLEEDVEVLHIGRSGNTGTNLTLLKVERTDADGITHTLVNMIDSNSGKIYNLAGQEVKTVQKGIYIQNGKKYVVK